MAKKKIVSKKESQKIEAASTGEEVAVASRQATKKASAAKKVRGKRYIENKAKVEVEKKYSLTEAVKLLKETSNTKFPGSAEVHIQVLKKGVRGEVELPHFQGKAKKVEIATDETLKKLEAGTIDFDILITVAAMMPKLAKYAKLLGPKGLMPNPKTGTIVDDPEKAAEKFAKPSLSYKTEAGAPLIHMVFGKTAQPEEELEKNLKVLISIIGPRNIVKATVNSTMGPGIKLQI